MFKKSLEKVTNTYSTFLAGGAGLSMFAVFLIIFINSTRRYAFDKSFEWGEQLPVFLAIYGVMFGVAWAYMNDQHVKFTILVDFISKAWMKRLNIFVDFIMIITGFVLMYSGYVFAAKRGKIQASGLINGAKDLRDFFGIDNLIILGKMYPYQFSIAFGGLLLALAALIRLLNRLYEADSDKVVEAGL
ncbi:TRAP transporter small permease subunit [Halarcobacter sp.]|uniref:TRAP transporter small permease n=1 Tax=Halarcobacter sp. TaxID=2321133 RepID=UPI0029F52365|nr:TRAP transporter small permease subunit [Halarcobacter sp.]